MEVNVYKIQIGEENTVNGLRASVSINIYPPNQTEEPTYLQPVFFQIVTLFAYEYSALSQRSVLLKVVTTDSKNY